MEGFKTSKEVFNEEMANRIEQAAAAIPITDFNTTKEQLDQRWATLEALHEADFIISEFIFLSGEPESKQ